MLPAWAASFPETSCFAPIEHFAALKFLQELGRNETVRRVTDSLLELSGDRQMIVR